MQKTWRSHLLVAYSLAILAFLYLPLLILAIGKGIEKIELVEISENDDHRYFRKDGIHYVPKVRVEDLIIG